MNVYRLDPIDPDDSSWRYSTEKNCVWAAAPTAGQARQLVADKTRLAAPEAAKALSPWQNVRVTSCEFDPSLTYVDDWTVVREDGSLVEG